MGPFPRRDLLSMLDAARRSGSSRLVSARTVAAPQTVALPPLPTGQHMLRWVPLAEHPPGAHWDERSYESVAAWICEFHDVLLHSDAGIACVGGQVVEDTLNQTNAAEHHYRHSPEGLVLHPGGAVQQLRGTWLSLLAFNHANYYHWMLDCLGRLAAADSAALAECAGVLVPELRTGFQTAGFALTGLQQSHAVHTVAADAALRVERVVVPWSISCDHRPHPCIRGFFGTLRAAAPACAGPFPPRVYIDRRGGPNRPLVNEDELVTGLAGLGFVPVRLERLSLAEQIALFANAEIVVAPHGAGLANIVFAQPGSRVVELHADFWVNWCFRRLAAVFDLRYDCVVGRQLPGPQPEWINRRSWAISLTHVLGAVEQALAA
nr:glycosyltransferase family 61 protein [Limobrevibacterium gyesilva]